jgi:hypothetical protein
VHETFNIPFKEDLNGEKYQTEGVAMNQFNIVDGKRYSVCP